MIIGAFGYKGSGKSVLASYLKDEHNFTRVNFKDALVKEMRENFVDTLEELSELYEMSVDRLFEEKPPVMRKLMQNYGTDVRRKDDDEYWIKRWQETVDTVEGDIIADDVRFDNELEAILEGEGVAVQVRKSDVTTGGTHVSETEQESFEPDFTIHGIAGDHHSVHRQANEILELIRLGNK